LADLTIDPSRKLILAVEDDEGAISIYKRYLEKRGYKVVGLNQGEQAVRWARELEFTGDSSNPSHYLHHH
jgi:CheY-like chemotaxis protein